MKQMIVFLKIHGFTTISVDKQLFNEISDEFLNFIEGKKSIIHNASFGP